MIDAKQKVKDFFSKYEHLIFKKGDIIIPSTIQPKHIYFLEEGTIKQTAINMDGEELTINLFSPESYFPMMIILSGVENEYSFIALEDCKVIKAPKDEVLEFLHTNPDVAFELLERFAKGLIGMANKLQNLMFTDTHSKLAALLVHLAEKFGENTNDGITIRLQMTHSEINAWLGIQRETVSRQFERLKNENIIGYNQNRQIVIKDLKKLKAHVNKTSR